MSYNGIGLATSRGTGTSGHVVKNLSHLRPRTYNVPPGSSSGSFGSDFGKDSGPPAHRAPDQGILDHERKRKVEVKCAELRDQLEDKDLDEDTIETRVSELRTKLLAQASSSAAPTHTDIRNMKVHDSHSLAAAKEAEMSKMQRAFGVRADYKEGGAFSRKDAEAERIERAAKREEADRKRAEMMAQREAERAEREAAFKEAEKKRRREEYYRKLEAEKAAAERKSRGDFLPYDDRSRSPSPPPRRDDRRPSRRSPSPPPSRRPAARDSRSPSPPPKRGRSFSPRSVSPPARRARESSYSDESDFSGTRSPSPKRARDAASRSPSPRRRPRDADSRSPSPRCRTRLASLSPPPRAGPASEDIRSKPPAVPAKRRESFDSQSSFDSRSSYDSTASRSPPPKRARKDSSPAPRRD